MLFVYDDGGRASAGYKGTTGDCACRAVAIAAQRPYQEVYDLINEYAKKERTGKRKRKVSNARTGVYPETFKKVMAHYGFEWVPTMHIGQGCTVHLRENELPKGRIVCNVSGHYTAVIDGVLNDTYDCTRDGSRCVYGYFIKRGTDAAKQDDSKQRAEFVRKHVASLLKVAFDSVDDVFYRKEPQTLDEFITTRYFDGRVVTFIVTRDPLPVIAYKALQNVIRTTDCGGGALSDTLPATCADKRT